MAANGNPGLPTASGARGASLIRRLIERINLRSLFSALPEGRRHIRTADTVAQLDPPERKMMRASEYLEICEEHALDAYTIEDALYWHNEIITELSIELNLVGAASWPDTVKASMRVALEHRLNQHACAVTRLAAILDRNQQFIWQP